MSYYTQNIGKDLERPDISGIDIDGNEVLLIEAKFWASLTHNQPNGYLKRLNNNSVLVFVVPTLRIRTVFEEVKNRITQEYQDTEINLQNHSILIKSSQQHVLIKSWNEILNTIKSKLEQSENFQLISDLNQIIGLCDSIDNNAFQPLTDDDLSPKIPKHINSYYDIVDKVVDELKKRNNKISTSGLFKTPQRYGYHRYFKTNQLGMTFALKLDFWEKYSDTPFWISFKEVVGKEWISSDKLKVKLETICAKHNHITILDPNNNGFFLNIKPILFETEDIVILNLVNQIELILNELKDIN